MYLDIIKMYILQLINYFLLRPAEEKIAELHDKKVHTGCFS